jgi:MFS transporter, ACS family, glucarate transporter
MYFGLVPQRFWLIAASFCLSALLYINLASISTSAPISTALELTEQQLSGMIAAFAIGYAALQIPTGMMADKYGGRRVLTGVIVCCSLLTALTAFAWNFVSLLIFQFLCGASAAGIYPVMARVVYSWLPQNERGLATGISSSGSRIGAVLASVLLPIMFASFGWRGSLMALLVTGLACAFYWWIWYCDDPECHHLVSRIELKRINLGRTAGEMHPDAGASLKQLLHGSATWLMMGQSFASSFAFFFCLAWLFPYMQRSFAGSAATGWHTISPLLASALGCVLAGWWVDRLYRSSFTTWSRKLPAIVGFVIAAIGLTLCAHQATALGLVFCLSLEMFGAGMTLAPSWTYCIDFGRSHSGAIGGAMNMVGVLGATCVGLAFPILVQRLEPTVFFYAGAALSLLASGMWLLVVPKHTTSPEQLGVSW